MRGIRHFPRTCAPYFFRSRFSFRFRFRRRTRIFRKSWRTPPMTRRSNISPSPTRPANRFPWEGIPWSTLPERPFPFRRRSYSIRSGHSFSGGRNRKSPSITRTKRSRFSTFPEVWSIRLRTKPARKAYRSSAIRSPSILVRCRKPRIPCPKIPA